MWLLGLLLAGVVVPIHSGHRWLDTAAALLCMGLLAVVTGIVESSMARIRLLRIPPLLIGAAALSVLALVLAYR
jgi:formate hydrogenlyase subunit 4